MISLGSNIAALRAERLLGRATNALGASYQRLSSGQRINRASDDAAGLSVADQLKNQSRLFGGATRNINDAISGLNIINGAVSEQTGLIQRLLELAEQSANGTYSSTQRSTMMQEYRQLLKEFGRLGDSTRFNGLALLLGGRGQNLSQFIVQAGINGSTESQLGVTLGDTGSISGTIREGYTTGSAVLGEEWSEISESHLYYNFGDRVARFSFTDANGVAHEIAITIEFKENSYFVSLYQRAGETGAAGSLYPDGFNTIGNDPNAWALAGSAGFTVNASTGKINGSGVFNLGYMYDNDKNGSYETSGNYSLDLRGLTFLPATVVTGMQTQTTVNSGVTAIDFTGIETQSRARTALTILNARLDELNGLLGQFGATQSRLERALAVVSAAKENTLAAESRIRDADVASEAAQLTAQRILQRTASSILASASQQPQLAIQLLQAT